MKPDYSKLPVWVGWIAQDADGAWWAYEHEPNMSANGWYENEVGHSIWLEKGPPCACWKEQIFRIENK